MNLAAMLVAVSLAAAQEQGAPEPPQTEPAAAPETSAEPVPAVQVATPPPQSSPQAPPPARPPFSYVPAEDERSPWYLGFALGTGSGMAWRPGRSASFAKMNDGQDTTVVLGVQAGWTVSPMLLVGLDLTALASGADANGARSSVTVANADAVATLFPSERGLFVRGGLGWSSLWYTVDDSIGGTSRWRSGGANVLAGVGYAFQIGRSFNLTVNVDLSQQWYWSGDIEGSRLLATYVGFGWY